MATLPRTRVSAAWYLLALIPWFLAGAVNAYAISATAHQIRELPRVVVPGEAVVELPAGSLVMYAETESTVDGVDYHPAAEMNLRCTMASAETGEPVALSKPTAAAPYSRGGFTGRARFGITIPRAGSYRVACDGDGVPGTIAIGAPVRDQTLLVLSVSSVTGCIGALLLVLLIRRRRQRAAAAAAAAVVEPFD